MTPLYEWAKRNNIPARAVTELVGIMGIDFSAPTSAPVEMSETAVQQRIRLDASRHGVRLWRNNNGATADESGRLIRFGLGNDSAGINKAMKSSDLIGITPDGRFISIEVKRPGWVWSGSPRERAQLAWGKLIMSMGGIFKFATKQEDWR